MLRAMRLFACALRLLPAVGRRGSPPGEVLAAQQGCLLADTHAVEWTWELVVAAPPAPASRRPPRVLSITLADGCPGADAATAPQGLGLAFFLAVVSTDFRAASDRTRLHLVAMAPRARGAPTQLVASWLTDAVGSSLAVLLGSASVTTGRIAGRPPPNALEHDVCLACVAHAAGLARPVLRCALDSAGVPPLILAGNLFFSGDTGRDATTGGRCTVGVRGSGSGFLRLFSGVLGNCVWFKGGLRRLVVTTADRAEVRQGLAQASGVSAFMPCAAQRARRSSPLSGGGLRSFRSRRMGTRGLGAPAAGGLGKGVASAKWRGPMATPTPRGSRAIRGARRMRIAFTGPRDCRPSGIEVFGLCSTLPGAHCPAQALL